MSDPLNRKLDPEICVCNLQATEVGLARPILEAVGWPLLAAFSVIMEDSDYRPHVASCMEGFRLGVQLTKVLRMETMRNAFLTSMVRLTSLHAAREMRTKNVDALRVMLQMAQQEPDSLQVRCGELRFSPFG